MLGRFANYHIVGQGLAGSLLAIALHRAGADFTVSQAALEGASTPVAPGIVNPLPGKKFKPVAEIRSRLDQTRSIFNWASGFLDSSIPLWNECPIVRVLNDASQEEFLQKAKAHPSAQPFIHSLTLDDRPLHAEFGLFLTKPAGWVNLPEFQRLTHHWLASTNRLIGEEFSAENVHKIPPHTCLIFAEGWRAAQNPLWAHIPFTPAKGEMLIGRLPRDLKPEAIYNRSGWLQPLPDNRWRLGATYSWDPLDGNPSLEASDELRSRLARLSPLPFTAEDQLAGVRPIVEDIQPVLGPHPELPNVHILNGLGSKGSLLGPAAVQFLSAYLLHGHEIPPAWSIHRFAHRHSSFAT